jgi:cardiolipin synthase
VQYGARRLHPVVVEHGLQLGDDRPFRLEVRVSPVVRVLRVTGPAVLGLQGAFAEYWLEATGYVLVGPGHLPELEAVRDDGAPMQVVRSSAGIGDTNVEALYFLAIASARERIELTAAYFVPRPAFIEALCDAADRGVAVRVLVPGSHIDKGFVRTAGRGTYEALLACGVRTRVLVPGPHIDKEVVRVAGRVEYDRLLEAGVEIYEYQPTMLHAKTLCIDGVWASVGSVNFDNRSFQANDEATLCVQSERVGGQLTQAFEADLEVAERKRPGRWRRRPLRQRVAERATKLIRREL